MKALLSRLVLRMMLSRFEASDHALDQLLGKAVSLQLNRISDEDFRCALEDFFSHLVLRDFLQDISFDAKREALSRPNQYRMDIVELGLHRRPPHKTRRMDLWGRRFSLLRHLHIRSDIVVLRSGRQIPPHGHHRVVSGFYVIEGEVGVRHYDRLRELSDAVLVRKSLDETLRPQGFTTNSEYFQNIHWLAGFAPLSFLLRVTVTHTPTSPFGAARGHEERIYVDPTGPPNAAGEIVAPYVDEHDLAHLRYRRATALPSS